MLRQISNAAINLIGGRAMHPLTALLSDLKVMRSTAELAPNILDKKHLVYLLALRGGSTNYIVMACSRVNCLSVYQQRLAMLSPMESYTPI